VTRLCVRPIFISKESNLLSHFNWLIVGCFTKCFFTAIFVCFCGGSFRNVAGERGRCNRCRYVTIFFCWSHLDLNRINRFLDEHLFSVREFGLKGFALCSLWIISERLLVRGRCKRVPLCDEFFCWSHLELNRFSRFLDEHFVFCLRTCFAGWCRCVSKLFFVFMVLFCLRSRSRLTIP